MRKDVQFGLTIGAMLVVVLVAWLSYINHSRQLRSPDVVVGPTDSSSVADTATTQPSTQPTDNSMTAAIPQTRPSPVASVDSDNLRDWNQLLQNGGTPQPIATTDTPTTQPTEMLAAAEFPVHDSVATTQPTASQSASTSPHTHVVRSGESFYTIAQSVYGDASQFTRIEDANPKVNPNKLRIGTVLVIPDAQDDDSSTPAPTADSSPVTTARAPLDTAKSYRVQQSDTLVSIARKLYGSSNDWEKIYDANRDTIGPNPGRLKVDMVLRLPARPTLAMAAN